VAFSLDGKTVASSGGDSAVIVWGLREERKVVGIYGGLPSASTVAFSPSGQIIAAGYYDNNARLWNADPKVASKAGTKTL